MRQAGGRIAEGDAFRRHLDAKTIELILSHPVSKEILLITHSDASLQAQLRGTTLDIYYEGYLMFRIGNRGRLQVGSVHDAWPDRPQTLDGLTPPQVSEWIGRVKQARRKQYRASSENSFESKFLRENDRPPSTVLPLDRQIVHPEEGLLRVDALLYDLVKNRLVLAELKVHDNPEMRTKVFDQLDGYRSLFQRRKPIQIEYRIVFEQKKTLGLIEHPIDTIDTSRPPALLLLVGGHPDSKYGTRMSRRAIENSLKMKRSRWPSLPVHIAYWHDFQRESLTLTDTVSDLPAFESWAEEMLS